MSRVSRRQRAHEEQAGKRKLRNLFAFLFVAVAVGIAVGFFYMNWSPGQTKIHVLVQRIPIPNFYGEPGRGFATRRHAIPFQDSTCLQLHEAFGSFANTDVENIQPIQGSNEKVGLSDEHLRKIDSNSISLLYVSGHLRLTEDRKSVAWIYPDQKGGEPTLEEIKPRLENFASSAAKLKIVFLDAGQFSWSPSHPNRAQEPFQDQLASVIKSLDEDANLWVILSHSPNEISLNCTPETISIFGLAIRETLSSLDSALHVPELFKSIYERCAYYSRNFGNEVLQSPMLFRSGQGLVEKLSQNGQKINFVKNRPLFEEDEEESDEQNPHNFRISFATEEEDLSDFKPWLDDYNEDHYGRPVNSMFILENFSEPGQKLSELKLNKNWINFNTWRSSEEQTKQRLVSEFRKGCLDLKLQLGIANHFLLWDSFRRENILKLFDNSTNNHGWSLFINYTDQQLESNPVSPGNALDRWNKKHDILVEELHSGWYFNDDNFETDLNQGKDQPDLTPCQAELLGIITQRLAPFVKTPKVAIPDPDENANSAPSLRPAPNFKLENENFNLLLDLPVDADVPAYAPLKDSRSPWQSAMETFNKIVGTGFLGDASEFSDSKRRIRLALYGSEDVLEQEPAEIGVYLGDPQIEFSFEDKLELHEGHNLFRGTIKNSQNFYGITAKVDNKNATKIPGVECHLFKPDQMFPDQTTDDSRGSDNQTAYVETGNEFVFYVFLRPAIERRPDEISFSFSAKLISDDENTQPLPATLTLKCSKEPRISIKATRESGADLKSEGAVGFLPWRTNSIPIFSIPPERTLQLNPLANLKSKFEFMVSNNSAVSLTGLTVQMYLLSGRKFGYVPPDAIPKASFTDELGMKTWNVISFFKDVDNARLLASAQNVSIGGQGEEIIRFAFNKPDEDPKQGSAPQKTEPEPFIHIDAPLVITLSDPKTSEAPLWFQIVEFSPKSPFWQNDWNVDSSPFQIDELISKRNRFIDFEDFKSLFIPTEILGEYSDPNNENSVLHLVSPGSVTTTVPPMSIEDAFNGQSFQVPAYIKPRTLGMVDVMGIPNLVTMEIDDDQIANIDSRIRVENFAGVKVVSDVWEPHYPGFLYNSEVFQLDPGTERRQQKLYLRKRPGKEDEKFGDITLVFSLPFENNVPVTSDSDFCFSWNQPDHNLKPLPLRNSTERNYFLATSDFSFLSTVKRHERTQPNIGSGSRDLSLKVFKGLRENRGAMIGNWAITTSNPNKNESIQILPPNIDHPLVNVTVDLSNVKPYCSNVRVGIEGFDSLAIEEHPTVFQSGRARKFSFSLRDFASESGFNLKRAVDDKKREGGGNVTKTLHVEVIDFFGNKLRREAKIDLPAKPSSTRRRKSASKPSPASKKKKL